MARFRDGTAFVVGDWGNRFLKGEDLNNPATMESIDNSVIFFNDTQWKQKRDRYKFAQQRFTNTEVFGFKPRYTNAEWIYCAVGDAAQQLGIPRVLTEEIKYHYDSYWGAVICSQLLRLYPEGHKSIVLAVAHPTKSIGQRGQMLEASAGKHVVQRVDGREITFIVREVLPWDEPVGGIVRWSDQIEAVYNKYDLRRNSVILVVDIGGGVTSFTRVVIDLDARGKLVFNPVYDTQLSPSFGIGIRQVMDTLRSELTENNPAFEGMKHITDDMLEEGIRVGLIRLRGEPVDVSANVMQAEYQLLDQIDLVYAQRMDAGRPFDVIVTTGGGMHSYHERLKAEAWNHPHVESAGHLETIHFANLMGGAEIMRQWVAHEVAE